MALKRKSALVTGSTSGIGLGVARSLAAEGVNITLNGFGPLEEIEKLRSGLEKEFGVTVIYNGADLTDDAAIKDLHDRHVEAFGGIDILVNNAGIQHTDKVEDFPIEKWNLIIDLMLSAPFKLMQRALPLMKKQKWGRVINIASVHGLVGSPNKAAYVSAKHGINGLTKVAAQEVANQGITVNSICPGWVLTPLVEKQVDKIAEDNDLSWDEAKERLLSEKQPLLEFTTPEKIGAMIVFLCTEAGSTMTGSNVVMDGGWSAR